MQVHMMLISHRVSIWLLLTVALTARCVGMIIDHHHHDAGIGLCHDLQSSDSYQIYVQIDTSPPS